MDEQPPIGHSVGVPAKDMTTLRYAAIHAPITYKVACNAFKREPDLSNSLDMINFMKVWSGLALDYALALIEQIEDAEEQ